MPKLAIWVQLEAKPGKEQEVAEFLKVGAQLAEKEPLTHSWYGVQLSPSTFGVFDTFADEEGRNAHLTGEIAKALMAKAPELLAKPPEIHKIDVVAAKKLTAAKSA